MLEAADPRRLIDAGPMRSRQFLVVAVCVVINAIDGFDILSVGLASPGIAREWAIDPASLGFLLSAELVGMGMGSLVLGQVADRVGRRPVLLSCLLLMTLGMWSAAIAPGFLMLCAMRVATGIGIGGMLPCLSATVAEVSNSRWRPTAMALMAAGYPAGAVFGGAIATSLLAEGTWRDVFHVGALFSGCSLPIAYLFLPEPLGHAMSRLAGPLRLAAINRSLRQLGHLPVDAVRLFEKSAKPRVAELFSKQMAARTLLLTAAYFLHMITFYFFLKWVPKIVAEFGFTPAEAGSVLVAANIGGLAGSLLLSVLALRIRAGLLLIFAMGATFASLGFSGNVPADLHVITLTAIVVGFFTNAAVVGLYALIAEVYPERLRAGGTGFSLGIGRAGAALGPIAAGLLFERGTDLQIVALVLGGGSYLALFVIARLLLVLRRI